MNNDPILLLPAIVFLVMLGVRRIKGRMPELAVAPLYEPPQGLTPAEAATLLTDKVEPRAITATLADLAVRAYIKLEPDTSEGGRDYIIRLAKPRDQWHGLASHEIDMLFNIFYGGQWTKLSSLKMRFAVAVPSMRTGIINTLTDKGMYRIDPMAAQRYRVISVSLTLLLVLGILGTGWFAQPRSGLAVIASLMLCPLVVHLMGSNLTAKSFKGLSACRQIEGFREFLERVDADRLQRTSPEQLERCIPYAIALGVERPWAKRFAGIAEEWPNWLEAAPPAKLDTKISAPSLAALINETKSVFGAYSQTSNTGSSGAPRNPKAQNF
jgi:hypothetical protein